MKPKYGISMSGLGLYVLDELYDMGEAIVREKVRRLSFNIKTDER